MSVPMRMLVFILVLVVPMVRHHSDEHRGEEHEYERLKEGDKEFEETDREREDSAHDADRRREAPTA